MSSSINSRVAVETGGDCVEAAWIQPGCQPQEEGFADAQRKTAGLLLIV